MPSPIPSAQKTLLIVEDEILPAMALRDELQDAGYVVMDLTKRHSEAIGAAKACKPDLALVNIKLQGQDIGIDIARDLKAMGIPVVFISGQVSRARTAATVAIGSFPKPYSAQQMAVAVGYLLARLAGDKSHERPEGLEVFDDELEASAVAAV